LASLRSSQPAVAVEGVTKRYGPVLAVDGVSLSIGQGESVALVGPSGAGKTTLLHMMTGTVRPDEGRVSVAGHDLAALRPGRELSSLVGIVAQQFDLVPNLSALQNVLAGRLGAWGMWRSLVSLVSPRDRPLAMAALERVGVAERAPVRAGRLSGGEQQRVAIARLLVQDPGLVLADEPVASLDPARAADVLALLTTIVRERGKTLVASMHAVDLAIAHFDRLVGMRNGAVVFDAPASEVDEGQLASLYLLEGMRGE
jgi:phosphonate transport system ATP-binding protein